MKVKNNEWHFFNIGEEFYIYNCLFKQAVQIDKEFYNLLVTNDDVAWREISNEFLKFDITPEQPLARNYYDLFLLVSNDCNAKCIYCFADQGCYGKKADLMDSATALRAIDFFMANIPSDAPANITFFGGEPLMAKDVIIDSVTHINKLYSHRDLSLSITTNGFLLDDVMVQYFIDNHVNISLSIDGGRALQQKQRPSKDGSDSFESATKSLDHLRNSKLPVIARGTYFDYDIDLEKIYNDLLLLQFKEVQIVPDFLHVTTVEDIRKLESQVESLYRYCVYYIENIMRSGEEFPFVSIAQQMRMLFFPPYSYTYSCERGKTLMAIDCAGDIFPCHRLSSDIDKVVGNIFKDNNYSWRTDNDNFESESAKKCKRCWNRYTCSHGCANNTEQWAKNAFCAYSKKMTEIAIAVTSKLSPQDIAKAIRL